MALEMTYNLNGDFPITAYLRISKINIIYNPTKAAGLGGTKWVATNIRLDVKSGKDKNVLDGWSDEKWEFAPDLSSNIIQQAYSYLKTQPDLLTAIDKQD